MIAPTFPDRKKSFLTGVPAPEGFTTTFVLCHDFTGSERLHLQPFSATIHLSFPDGTKGGFSLDFR